METVAEVVQQVEGETKKVEGEVVNAAKEVVAEVEKVADRVRVEIEAVEKLVLRDAETEFLRAQVQARDLQAQLKEIDTKAQAAAKKYQEQIEALVKKYAIDKTKMFFDNLENVFKATPNQAQPLQLKQQ